MIFVIVEISVVPEHMAQFADDVDRVYAEIFRTVPVVFFETAEAYHAAEPLIEGVREATAISPGGTFTLVDYVVIVRGVGAEADKLFSPIGSSGAPGAPA
jgi:hypothetical protein